MQSLSFVTFTNTAMAPDPARLLEQDAFLCRRTMSALNMCEQAEEWLLHCKDHLKPGTYALETFTFADISAAAMIEYLQIVDSLRYAWLPPTIA